jgi:hypothetical protein
MSIASNCSLLNFVIYAKKKRSLQKGLRQDFISCASLAGITAAKGSKGRQSDGLSAHLKIEKIDSRKLKITVQISIFHYRFSK